MPYDRPSLVEIINRIENDFVIRVEDSQTFLQKSVFKIFARVLGGSNHLLYDFIEYVKDQLFISSADGEFLEKHGGEYGISRLIGEKATGTVLATGTDGITIPVDTELQSASGNKYKTTAEATISSNQANIDIVASEFGTSYNELAGVILTFLSPIPGVNATVTVIDDGIEGGVNADTDIQYQEKILNRKRFPPHGGIQKDYVAWCLEYSGNITRAWAIPEYQGIGTIGLAFVKDNDTVSIFPTEAERDAVRNYIIEHLDSAFGKNVGIPVTAEPGFFLIKLEPYTIDFTIQLYPNNSTVRTNVIARLTELINQESAPAGTIALSQFYEAITSAVGEEKCRIIYPTGDVAVSAEQLHRPGSFNFLDYTY
jgi:uncharacterized phage protein gp47/JayE